MSIPRVLIVAVAFALASLQASSSAAERPEACAGPILSSRADVENYIRRSEHEWTASVVTRDKTTQERIWSEDFTWVIDGHVLDRKKALAVGQNHPGRYISNVPGKMTIRFYGDAAVAQGSETWTAKNGRSGKWVWTDTWIGRDGCWQMVSAQDTTVPLPKK